MYGRTYVTHGSALGGYTEAVCEQYLVLKAIRRYVVRLRRLRKICRAASETQENVHVANTPCLH